MIEIDIRKLERGIKIEWRTVTRNGKTFKQRFRVGEKEISERESLIKVINWIDSHIRSQTGIKPSEEIIKIIKDHKWTYTGKVYRGINFRARKPYESAQGVFNVGDEIKEKKDFSSWTSSKNVAISFAVTGAHSSWVINDKNPYFPSVEQRAKEYLKSNDWEAGMILESNIHEGIDIEKIRNDIEENSEVSDYASGKLPTLHESEILSLKPVKAKITKHYHAEL
jgi:hypothetical protein